MNVERHWNLLEGINLREVQNSDVLKQMHSDLRSIVDATANQVLNGITNEGEVCIAYDSSECTVCYRARVELLLPVQYSDI